MCEYLKRLEEGTRLSAVGFTSNYEWPYVGEGNLTPVLQFAIYNFQKQQILLTSEPSLHELTPLLIKLLIIFNFWDWLKT